MNRATDRTNRRQANRTNNRTDRQPIVINQRIQIVQPNPSLLLPLAARASWRALVRRQEQRRQRLSQPPNARPPWARYMTAHRLRDMYAARLRRRQTARQAMESPPAIAVLRDPVGLPPRPGRLATARRQPPVAVAVPLRPGREAPPRREHRAGRNPRPDRAPTSTNHVGRRPSTIGRNGRPNARA